MLGATRPVSSRGRRPRDLYGSVKVPRYARDDTVRGASVLLSADLEQLVDRDVDAVPLLVDRAELAVLQVALHPVVDPRLELRIVLAQADAEIVGLHDDLRLGRARRVLLVDRR